MLYLQYQWLVPGLQALPPLVLQVPALQGAEFVARPDPVQLAPYIGTALAVRLQI